MIFRSTTTEVPGLSQAEASQPPEGQFAWDSFGLTHVGTVRELNEDALLLCPEVGLWAVADGMGGHEAGEVASQLVVDNLASTTTVNDLNHRAAIVSGTLERTNSQLRKMSQEQYQGKIIGTTAVIILLDNSEYRVVWAGDSRAYLFRDHTLTQISRDHSQVEEMISAGLLRREEAENHPMSNVITRAVGADDHLEVDTISGQTHPGDLFLLCSDGLNKVLGDRDIEQLLTEMSSNIEEAGRGLIHTALVRNADDNVTIILVRFPG